MVTQAGSGVRSNSALYHPFIHFQSSLWRGGPAPNRRSIYLPVSSVRRLLSLFWVAFIVRPRSWVWTWSLAESRRTETILLTSLHMSSNINAFYLASLAFVLKMDLCRATKSTSSIVGVVRGQRVSRVRLPRYLVCFLRGELWRHSRTM